MKEHKKTSYSETDKVDLSDFVLNFILNIFYDSIQRHLTFD